MSDQVPTILVTDIFGINAHLLSLIKDSGLTDNVTIIDPYDGQTHQFDTQQQAYDAFIKYGGLEHYTNTLRQHILGLTQPHRLLGFSAGGSAVWRMLDQSQDVISNIAGARCFYPGQIRNFVTLQPKVDVTLTFPSFEAHFELQPVIEQLKNTPRVVCVETDHEHGFMNAQLAVFNQQAYKAFCQEY